MEGPALPEGALLLWGSGPQAWTPHPVSLSWAPGSPPDGPCMWGKEEGHSPIAKPGICAAPAHQGPHSRGQFRDQRPRVSRILGHFTAAPSPGGNLPSLLQNQNPKSIHVTSGVREEDICAAPLREGAAT